MRAVTWHGRRDVRVDDVPDPRIEEPTDAIIEVTSTGICGSDLHLYEMLGMYLHEGDILGHEPMGIVREVGSSVDQLQPGNRVVIPFNISCGHCYMCDRELFAQCETTQVREQDKGAALFGYTELYGSVPGGQAEYLRVPQAHFGPIVVPEGPPDDRFVYLSDVLPTAWQAVRFADVPDDGTLVVFGLGPIGHMCCRVARLLGAERIIALDLVPERLARAAADGVETIDLSSVEDVSAEVKHRTAGRGADSVIDAVGMEAHGAPVVTAAQRAVGVLPRQAAQRLTEHVGLDRLTALHDAIHCVRRGGTLSIIGVYGGAIDPMPMMELFDKGVQIRMGQAHVRRWVDEILPYLERDDDPLGTETFATHHLPLNEAPAAYKTFQEKNDGAVKILLRP